MLNCIYHPIDSMRVVTDDEKKVLLATGVWFDTPQEAKSCKAKQLKIANDEAKKSKPKKEKVNEK